MPEDILGFGKFGAASLESQQRAMSRNQAILASRPPAKPGEMLADVLGARGAEIAARKRETAEANVMNGITEQVMAERSQGGAPVDLMQAQSEILLRGAREFARQGNPARARELYQQAAVMQAQYDQATLERAKIKSEIEENLRPPKDNEPEIIDLQNARDGLYERLRAVTLGEARGDEKMIQSKIDELDKRISTLAENATTTYDPSLTTGAATSAMNNLMGIQDQIVRLGNIKESVDGQRQLLTPGGKLDVMLAMGRDRFDSASPEDKMLIRDWTNLKQASSQQVNLILKELSGAAVSNQEYGRQLEVELNPGTVGNPFSGDTPEEFMQKLENKIAWANAAQERYLALVNSGRLKDGQPVTEELVTEFPLSMYGAPDPAEGPPMTISELMKKYPGLAEGQ